MLTQRLRRWANIKPTLGPGAVIAWLLGGSPAGQGGLVLHVPPAAVVWDLCDPVHKFT